MNVILVGPPGAGKGTQAAVLEEKTKLKHVASGDLFRQHMLNETPLGLQARSFVSRGELVPDDIVIGMILDRVFQPDCSRGVIFDGFPRTQEQAQALAHALQLHHKTLDAVVFLSAPRDTLLKRIGGRQTCRTCQTPYNLYYNPSREEGMCDLCNGTLYTRPDDNLETARHRLDVYMAQTMPLIEHYRSLGLLHEVDGLGDVHEVTARVVQQLGLASTEAEEHCLTQP